MTSIHYLQYIPVFFVCRRQHNMMMRMMMSMSATPPATAAPMMNGRLSRGRSSGLPVCKAVGLFTCVPGTTISVTGLVVMGARLAWGVIVVTIAERNGIHDQISAQTEQNNYQTQRIVTDKYTFFYG